MTRNSPRVQQRPRIEDAPPAEVLGTRGAPLQPHVDTASIPSSSVQLLSFDDFMTLDRPKYLIEGLLAERSLTVLYADAESGKSFIALDMLLSIATALPWHGLPVLEGQGVYIVGEGSGRFPDRIRGWCQGEDQQRVEGKLRGRAWFVPGAVQVLSPKDFGDLREQIRKVARDLRLIVVDTLARCLVGGDENLAADMGLFVSRCDELRREFNCAVLVLHHCNQRGGERGSTALGAAADTMILAKKAGELITLSCQKQKDAAHFDPIVLRLHVVEVEHEKNGTPVTSCRLEVVDDKTRLPRRLSSAASTQLSICTALRDDTKGAWVPADNIAVAKGISKSSLARHLKCLIDNGCVRIRGKGKNTQYRFVKLPTGEGPDASR